MRDIDF